MGCEAISVTSRLDGTIGSGPSSLPAAFVISHRDTPLRTFWLADKQAVKVLGRLRVAGCVHLADQTVQTVSDRFQAGNLLVRDPEKVAHFLLVGDEQLGQFIVPPRGRRSRPRW